MPMAVDDGDDFALNSSDEENLIALTQAVETPRHSSKRKISTVHDEIPSKRIATESPAMLQLAVTALTKTFGLKEFRLKQEQAIARILAGGSAAVIFPTGGGKSLCYQVPAVVFPEMDKFAGLREPRESGITLVVSPLIALMKDQVDALRQRGISAATLDSTKSREEYLHTSEMLRNGELNLLYCAPERLNNEGFVESMKHVRGGVRLLAVDEAHCISEWGHSFRPDYLKVSRFATEIRAERVVCLTATATPRVAKDICEAFNIDESGLFRTSTYRPNLQLLAQSATTKQALYPKLFKFLRRNPGPSIVYVTLQKQTEALANDLRIQGFKAKAFHAGMETALKTKLQDEFMACEDLIIVATIAFGMGIDKASIRSVVHFNIPSSIESYSQEIGRAGRDGKTSTCMFFVCGEDLHLRDVFARGDLPSRESVRALLRDIFDVTAPAIPVGGELKTAHYSQEKEHDIRPTTLKNIYAQLELRHGLIRALTPIYTKYSYKPGNLYESNTTSDDPRAASAIKKFSKLSARLYHVDVDIVATKADLLRADIIRKLNQWNEDETIDLKASGVINVYRVIRPLPRTSAEIEHLVEDLFSLMQQREQQAVDRTEAVLQLITGSSCFSRSLCRHFGDDLPGGKQECGHCTWCLTHSAVPREIPRPVPVDRSSAAFKEVLKMVPVRDDARLLARVAFGITSPRVTAMKLSKNPVFGSMATSDFMELLSAFASECGRANSKAQ